MKKMILFAAMALLALSAQAVAVAWTGNLNTFITAEKENTAGGGGVGSTYAAFRVNDSKKSDGYKDVTRIGVVVGSASGTVGAKWSTATYAVICLAGTTEGAWEIVATSNARTYNVTTNTVDYPGTGRLMTFDFETAVTLTTDVDYRLFFTETAPTGATFDVSTAVERSIAGTKTLTAGSPTTMIGTDTTNAYVAINGEAFTVPEPTLLALLALGVAGLALKRKEP